MNTTENYNLKKPEYSDYADISDFNDNMDIIDEELTALNSNFIDTRSYDINPASESDIFNVDDPSFYVAVSPAWDEGEPPYGYRPLHVVAFDDCGGYILYPVTCFSDNWQWYWLLADYDSALFVYTYELKFVYVKDENIFVD